MQEDVMRKEIELLIAWIDELVENTKSENKKENHIKITGKVSNETANLQYQDKEYLPQYIKNAEDFIDVVRKTVETIETKKEYNAKSFIPRATGNEIEMDIFVIFSKF